jgi:hypothetical protein
MAIYRFRQKSWISTSKNFNHPILLKRYHVREAPLQGALLIAVVDRNDVGFDIRGVIYRLPEILQFYDNFRL